MKNISVNSIKYLCVCFLFCFYFLSLEAQNSDGRSRHVLVSVSPHKFMVEKIGGNTVEVDLMVPAGSSAHTFEPSPKQMLRAGKADLWFYIGESFETRAIASLKAHHPRMQLVDLRKNLNLISGGCACHQRHANTMDLHFWLSPRLAKQQAETIAEGLITLYPEHQEEYLKRLQAFLNELTLLDQEVSEIFQKPHNPAIMVSHPAYAYLCRDYGCEQISIEFEGKDPTPQQLTKILQTARNKHISVVFIQPQYSSKGAYLIAKEIGAETILLDPYAENILDSIRQIAKAFVSQSQ